MYRNSEGYADPTAGAALAHITYEERLEKRRAERLKREAERKRQAAVRQKNQRSSPNRQIHWVKVWPKEESAKIDNTGVSE